MPLNAPDFEALTPAGLEFLGDLKGKQQLNAFQDVRPYRRYGGERNVYNAEVSLQFLTAINLTGFGDFADDATKWRSRNDPQPHDESHFD